MSDWHEGTQGGGGQFLKVNFGETVECTINEIIRVTDKPKFDLKDAAGNGIGHHFSFVTDKGALTVGAWTLFNAFKNSGCKAGDKVKIMHPEKGKWAVLVIA